MPLDPLFVYGNHAEACFWAGLGVAAYVKRSSRAGVVLAVALLAFGLSDIVETRTGAWYRPLWLLVWKVVCVAGIVSTGVFLLRNRSRR